MATKHHKQTAADVATMVATRAYMATLPKLAVVPESRGWYDDFMTLTPAADGVRFEPGTVAGVEGWWCIPADAPADAALLHLHGGGYVLGSALAYCNFVSHLAQQARVSAFIPDYALAPEAPFPASFDHAVAIIEALQDSGRTRLAISGDSAGGGLALAAAQTKRLALRGILLISPWTDLTLTSASLSERADADPILTPDALVEAVALYARSGDTTDPRISPRFGTFTGLPPIMVHVGTDEILLDDAKAVDDAAEHAGVPVTVHIWDGMTHGFLISLASLEAAREAIELAAAFVRGQLGEGHGSERAVG
ncbi:alpha/beta hydrolase family protein (plasmid) [Rhizobium phaseoli]|uniref:alpha/beta hydrolase fold domain-containing protein n=1 Tax=Rhizobium phaseoli TaxID=396 RepID=UPI0007EBD998|nr:alpha/beta hydrolase fold domain-containing protein [Rhizobium phaseoli]ANL51064.1 alpha/beta hydrolase family protein [Rhizobium phaseoli]